MRFPRLLALAAAALVLAAAAIAGSASARPNAVANLVFGPAMARADIVATTKGAVRLHRVDRGRIRALRPSAVVLQWRDGTTATVPVAEAAVVTGLRRAQAARRSLGGLRRGMHVVTLREGAQPATRVHVLPPAAPLPRRLLGPALGPALSRAGIVHRTQAGMTVYWVDRGRVRSVGPDSVSLLERDGTTVQLTLAPDVIVTGLRGRRARLQAPPLRRGMLVETVREGDGPVVRVHVLTG